MPEKIKVNLEILDEENEKIKTLVGEIKEQGTYQVEFDATGFTGGEYFYTLKAGQFIEIKKMLILR